MKSVIVLGGCGAFGTRLSRRLSADGWSVLVAGRNQSKAAELASQLPYARPLVADRERDLSPVLLRHRPFLLIDAAGPFQGSSYQVAEACIANGVHYIDLADARGFVAGMTSLDAAARRAGITVVTGASSVPALSGAVVQRLAADMDDVRVVNLSISASNKATAGASIAAAILSYVGRPVRLWRGRRWVQEIGWRMLRWETYRVAGQSPIRRHEVAVDRARR
ncbi:saccharopine dehydrogenase NADP-binding domain-containing protein [Rhizobium sp. CF142]|uniref:saccharopine dehydrogenase NADP-binding domain-containing protein n=1 Tax=Rhizobium sp. CF142 TaxID=1144314 RepID=UPI0006844089|nr:saccharopine dehydrogenase NADP-binding domain-containing protein [Rhizobium sp. CF142]